MSIFIQHGEAEGKVYKKILYASVVKGTGIDRGACCNRQSGHEEPREQVVSTA